MRVTVAGAGKVGRSIARELVGNGHEVLLIDKDVELTQVAPVKGADMLFADACEISTLDEASLSDSDVVVAATGDDKVNLVVALLAKTEYGVPRVVARVNHPKNEWLFDESWGVDVAVSTPRMMSALVEEAVTIGDLVRLFTFRQGEANLVEMTLPADAEIAGSRIGDVVWPVDAALVAIVRGKHVLIPDPDGPLESGDELLFVCTPAEESDLQELLAPGHLPRPAEDE